MTKCIETVYYSFVSFITKVLNSPVYSDKNENEKEEEDIDNQILKIHTEYSYIKTLVHHHSPTTENDEAESTPKLVLMLDRDVKYQNLPLEFQGLPFCYFPKRLKVTVDENCRRLVGMLTDVEPVQIKTKYKKGRRKTLMDAGPVSIVDCETDPEIIDTAV